MNPERGIALLGFMGAGKSTVGRALAERLGWRFVDLDAVLERSFGSIEAQFARDGETVFRERERETLASIPSAQTVLALGGGTPVDPRNRGQIERCWRSVWLDIPLATSAERVGPGTGRPLWKDAGRRFVDRLPLYRTARSRVDADRPVSEIVDTILASLGPRVEHVALSHTTYPITIAHDFEGFELEDDVHVVSDSNVGPLWSPHLDLARPPILIPAGESYKTIATWSDVVQALLAARCQRGSTVLALGGGVVGDLAGFAAATVNRGCGLIQVPTTTLAMVDSSVGGKTGVNHALGKNLVGAFHQPQQVWANIRTLETLSQEERTAGLAEVLKMAVCFDPPLFEFLESEAHHAKAGNPFVLEHLIASSVRIKAHVVAEDEREAGIRMALNAGHTVGHGIERAAQFGSVRHGEAVAIGLVYETRWAEREGFCTPGLAARIARIFAALGLPVARPPDLDTERIVAAMQVDKKARRDTVCIPVPTRVGACAYARLPFERLTELLSDT